MAGLPKHSPIVAESVEMSSIPGTVHLVDLDHNIRAAHASGKGSSSDIVLVPAPSKDPDDPLNWSPRRKVLSVTCMSVYTLVIAIASAAIYSIFVPLGKETGLTQNELNNGTGYMFLLFGWGCLIWQPIALQYGKRPVYLISMLGTLAVMVWTPYTNSSGQYLASKILQGFFGAPIETLCEISVADVYFQHERGTYIGLYALMLAGSSYLAPFLAGFIADGQGWQWVMYWCAIFLAVGFVFNFFFMEETNYDRKIVEPVPHLDASHNSPDEAQASIERDSGEKSSASSESASLAYQRKSYFQKLSIAPQHRPFQIHKLLLRPLILLSFPVIFYAGFSYGATLIWFSVLNGTTAAFFSIPPYNFTPGNIGLTYISPLIGVLLGGIFSGRAGDWFVLRLARRRGGILEPEYRLWLFAVSAVLVPGGLLLWGVGAAHSLHWFALVVAMGIIGASNTIGVQLSVSYAIDSYRALDAEALVSVVLIRNTMSFAIGYGLSPWVGNMGQQNAFLVAAFAGLAQCLTFLAMVKWGKGMRVRSRERYWKFVEKGRALGIAH